MKCIKHLVAVATLGLALVGCSGLWTSEPNIPPSTIYPFIQEKLHDGNFKAAIKQLEALDHQYPFGPSSQQVKLDLIYAYYKNKNFSLARAAIEHFMRLNPTHPNIDYVIYMKGLIDMALDDADMQEFFISIDHSDRDQIYIRDAFSDFSQLLNDYPNSQYAADAQKRLVFLKERLAKYELLVAKFYTKRNAYVAVVNRVEGMIKDYPDTQATHEALTLMENAYRQLHMTTEADKVAKIVAANKHS